MTFSLHRLDSAEPDYDLLALAVSGGTFAIGAAWLGEGLPLPHCAFRALTGCPCPTCGATRCLLALLHGHAGEALCWNPLAFMAILGAALYGIYAAVVTAARLPRLRFALSHPEARATRITVAAALLGNWAYLIDHGV